MDKFVCLCFLMLFGCGPGEEENGVGNIYVGEMACEGQIAEDGELLAVPGNLRNLNGTLRTSIYISAEGFPNESEKAVDRHIVELSKNANTCIKFSGLEAGKKYAVIFLHDEDNSGDLTRNFVGAPAEGYGTSRDAPPEGTNPPAFENAKFSYDPTKNIEIIPIRY